MLGSTGGIDGLGDAPWARGSLSVYLVGEARSTTVAARTTSTEEQNKYPILFAEFGDQVLRLRPLKKGITGFAFLCFASSPLETM